MQENGGMQTLKRLLTKQISWGCHHQHQMLIPLMENQGLFSHAQRNVCEKKKSQLT